MITIYYLRELLSIPSTPFLFKSLEAVTLQLQEAYGGEPVWLQRESLGISLVQQGPDFYKITAVAVMYDG